MKKLSGILLVLVLVLSFAFVPASPVAADPGIVGLWHFDESDGTAAADSSGNGNTGTLVNMSPPSCWIVGKFGNALQFDGSDDYVNCGANVDNSITGGITLEAWIKPLLKQKGGIISNDITYNTKKGYDFFLWDGYGTYGSLFIDFGNGSTLGRIYWSIPSSDWYNNWHHIAATWNSSEIKLYADGVEVANALYSGSYSDPGKATLIGGINYSTIPYCPFNGLIDEVRIWDTAYAGYTVSAAPEEAYNPVNTDHSITATISPVAPGVTVGLEVTAGPNASDTDSDVTDSNGQVTLSYTGDGGAGEDTILIWVDNNWNDTYDDGIDGTYEVTKYWLDGYLSGGGQLVETTGSKRSDWKVISFGGVAGDAETAGFVGEWEVNFHNVGVDSLDKTKFHTNNISVMHFYEHPCGITVNFTAFGEWQGIPGYKIIFRAQDSGEPGFQDNVRIEFYNPGGAKVYDTNDGDFTPESDCNGTARTFLDNGNLQLVLPAD